MSNIAPDSLAAIAKYFRREGEGLSVFKGEWEQLSPADKADLKKGFGDGTLTY